MKKTEQEKRKIVYDLMSVSEELRQKAESFASSGKNKTERDIRAGRHRPPGPARPPRERGTAWPPCDAPGKSINSLVLSFLHSLTLISIHDYWKNHSLD